MMIFPLSRQIGPAVLIKLGGFPMSDNVHDGNPNLIVALHDFPHCPLASS